MAASDMGSEEPRDVDTVEPDEEVAAPEEPPVPVWDGAGAEKIHGEKRRRKLILLALLLLLLALLAWVAWYVNANKRLPIPETTRGGQTMEPPRYLYSITGVGRLALQRPICVAVGRNGRVYVGDVTSRSIKVFTLAGRYLFEFRDLSDGKAKSLNAPIRLAIDEGGNLWVTDRLLNGTYIFNADGKFLREFVPGGDAKEKWAPMAIALGSRGWAYFSDVRETTKHRIRVFDDAAKEVYTFGRTQQVKSAREAIGSFYFPNGLAVNGATATRGVEVYVADGDNRRIQVFSQDGTFKRLIVTEGVPRAIVLDRQTPEGLVLVSVDALAHQVDIYSLAGEKLTTFGEAGVFDGQFQYPNDISLDTRGRMYIVDRANSRVQVWGFGEAEIPGITKLPKGVPPWACVLPLLLLPLLLLLRKRKFMVTADFVEGMVAAQAVDQMDQRKYRWIVAEHEYGPFEGRVVDGVNLGEMLHAEPYSYSDASDLAARLHIVLDRAGLLAMGQRYKNLCTEDDELARLASALDIPAYDRVAWLAKYGRKTPGGGQAGESGTSVE